MLTYGQKRVAEMIRLYGCIDKSALRRKIPVEIDHYLKVLEMKGYIYQVPYRRWLLFKDVKIVWRPEASL